MNLKRETRTDLNITGEATVLTYTHTEARLVEAVVRLDLLGLSGTGGTYTAKVTINGIALLPASNVTVTAGITQAILSSKIFPLEQGDAVVVSVVGVGGDTTVDTITSLRDVTSTKIQDFIGYGTIAVDHNYGGANALAFQTSGGAAIAGADVHVFSQADWDDGNQHPSFAIARAITTSDQGRWAQAVMLEPGDYTLRYTREGYNQATASITVV